MMTAVTAILFFLIGRLVQHGDGCMGCRVPSHLDRSQISVEWTKDAESRIVRGHPARVGEFPYILQLRRNGKRSCSASLIHERMALTTAPCVEDNDLEMYKVVAGEHNLRNSEGREQTVNVIKIYKHRRCNNTNGDNCIALLKLSEAIRLNQFVQKIRLPTQNQQIPENLTATASGWGLIAQKTEEFLTVDLSMVNRVECNTIYSTMNLTITDNMLCAGVDICHTDFGGLLVLRKYLGGVEDLLVGVTRGHNICCGLGYPGVFIKVAHYVNWIESVLDQEGLQPQGACGGLVVFEKYRPELFFENGGVTESTCVWIIRSQFGGRIGVTVMNVNYNGTSATSTEGRLSFQHGMGHVNLKPYEESSQKTLVTTTHNEAKIVLNHSDTVLVFVSQPGESFRFRFDRIGDRNETLQKYTTSRITLRPAGDGTVKSYSHPPQGNYLANSWVYLVLEPLEGKRIRLSIQFVETERQHDYIKVYLFSKQENRFFFMDKLSGQLGVLSDEIFLGHDGQPILIFFRSDDSDENRGFRFAYSYESSASFPEGLTSMMTPTPGLTSMITSTTRLTTTTNSGTGLTSTFTPVPEPTSMTTPNPFSWLTTRKPIFPPLFPIPPIPPIPIPPIPIQPFPESESPTTDSSSTTTTEKDCSQEDQSESSENKEEDEPEETEEDEGEEGILEGNIIYPKCICKIDDETTTTEPPPSSENPRERCQGGGNRRERVEGRKKKKKVDDQCEHCKCPKKYPVCFYTQPDFTGKMAAATKTPVQYPQCWTVDRLAADEISSLILNQNCIRLYSNGNCSGLSSLIFLNDRQGVPPQFKKVQLSDVGFSPRASTISFSSCSSGVCGQNKRKSDGTARERRRKKRLAISDYACAWAGGNQPNLNRVIWIGPYLHLERHLERHWGIRHDTGVTQRLHDIEYQRRHIQHHEDNSWYDRIEWFRVQYHWVPDMNNRGAIHEGSFCEGRGAVTDNVKDHLGLGTRQRDRTANENEELEAGHIVPDRMCGSHSNLFNFFPQRTGFNQAWAHVEAKVHRLVWDDLHLPGRWPKWIELTFDYGGYLRTNVPQGFWFRIYQAEPFDLVNAMDVPELAQFQMNAGWDAAGRDLGTAMGYYYNA